jgi:hypothetical protein
VTFAQATAKYAKLVLDYQQRRDPDDPERCNAEEREILQAARHRQQIRERLEAHEATAHPEPGKRAETAFVLTE